MTPVLELTLLLDEVLVLLGSLVGLVRPSRGSLLGPAALTLQVLLLAQAAVALVWLARGSGLARPGLFACYLLASTALLPLAGALARRPDLRVAAARLGTAAALALVVQLRLATLWAERG